MPGVPGQLGAFEGVEQQACRPARSWGRPGPFPGGRARGSGRERWRASTCGPPGLGGAATAYRGPRGYNRVGARIKGRQVPAGNTSTRRPHAQCALWQRHPSGSPFQRGSSCVGSTWFDEPSLASSVDEDYSTLSGNWRLPLFMLIGPGFPTATAPPLRKRQIDPTPDLLEAGSGGGRGRHSNQAPTTAAAFAAVRAACH